MATALGITVAETMGAVLVIGIILVEATVSLAYAVVWVATTCLVTVHPFTYKKAHDASRAVIRDKEDAFSKKHAHMHPPPPLARARALSLSLALS